MFRVFIDGGGNKLFGVKRYLNNLPEFNRVYVFEPNPLFHEEYSDTEFVLLKQAIWTKNCTLPFHLSKDERQVHSSLIEDKLSRINSQFLLYWEDKPIEVECIDFSEWLNATIDSSWHVTLKLDIEGAEYQVLSHILETGAIRLVDELYVEFHQEHLKMQENQHKTLVKRLTKAGLPPQEWD